MPLQISRNDIRNIKAEAIVDPTDNFLSGSGGTDKIIHSLAGPDLEVELMEIGFIEDGEAVLTNAYGLNNCKYIIHTAGPRWIDGKHQEEEILASCYENCLKLAKEKKLDSIAFPLIASGSFSFPKGRALRIASDTITSFLLENEMDVSLLVYDKESFDTASKLYSDIKDYLNENLAEMFMSDASYSMVPPQKKKKKSAKRSEKPAGRLDVFESYSIEGSIEKERFIPDESFSECLIRMIDEREMKDPEVYKAANIDRKLFNHIKNTKNYRPKKETAVALAIGMRLNSKDTDTLLERAGFILSGSSKFDLIIRYCIEQGIYNIFEINEILFEEDQKTLGC